NGVRGEGGSVAGTSTTTTSTVTAPLTTTTTTVVTTTTGASVAAARIDGHQEVFGFEKTFFDGNISVGMRLPILQQVGDGSIGGDSFGDLSVILKGLMYRNPDAGVFLSGGLMVTFNTGPAIQTSEGNINWTLLQPFIGYFWGGDSFYLQGFTSVVV